MNVNESQESLKIEQRRNRRLKLLNRYLHGRREDRYHITHL